MKKHQKIKYGTSSPKRQTASSFQEGDVNSKRIFRNPILCAQFLRDYSGLDILKNVQPEDIESVNIRYHIFGEAELSPDSVVRIWTGKSRNSLPLYIVPLIEHKSSVDYNVAIQLLTYMLCIWKDWEKEMKEKYHLDCKSRDFRYPFIFPIVYFEGAGNWTANMQLSSRIFMGDTLRQYIPDFTYHLVRTHDYTNEELLEKRDEMSLLMLLNKIQRAEDFNGFQSLMTENVDLILKDSPESVVDIIAGTAQSLCRKLNVPEDETSRYLTRLRKDRKMGYLFENMEKMDIQLERRLRKEAEERLSNFQDEAEEKLKKETESHIQAYVEVLQEFNCTYEDAVQRLTDKFSLTRERAEEKARQYWN